MSNNNVVKAKNEIDKLLDYIINLWKKGVTEGTFNFHDNYGFLGNQVIQIDVGEFHSNKATIIRVIDKKSIIKKESFKWLYSKYPILAEYLVEQVNTRFVKEQIFYP